MAMGRSVGMPASSASLSVPPTQNTAPVIKFQCLFTHDVRRKAKRWQDGFLRFHTFNKRIMVYDVSGNFVGDLHRQADADIQDGDELELDQGGVLVQVGECLERTQADLSPLLEKRKGTTTRAAPTTGGAASPSRQGNPLPQQMSSASTPIVRYPSHRLKPLKEVLQRNRGLNEGTAPPTKLSYEATHAGHNNTECAGRPSKRHKRNAGHDGNHNSRYGDASGWPERPNRSESHDNPLKVTLSSRESAETTVSRASEPNKPNPSGLPSFQPASMVKPSNSKDSSKSRRKSPERKSSSQQRSIADVFPVDDSANLLRFPTQKPRNKLICKDLLSASSSDKRPTQEKGASGDHSIRDKARLPKTNNPRYIPESHRENDNDRSTITKSSVLTPTDGNSTLAFIPSVSTLQALEEAAAPPASQRDSMISDFFQPSKPGPLPEPAGDENLYQRPSPAPNPPRSLVRSHSDMPPDAAAPSAITDGTSLLPQETSDRQQRCLQKSHSDVSSSLRVANHDNSSSGRSFATHDFQTKLSHMTTASDDCHSSLNDGEEEHGPWTCEALDLFDWWPPERTKPTLSASETGRL